MLSHGNQDSLKEVRTKTDNLEDVPQIKAEMERIESDYEFLCSDFTWTQAALRIDQYKALDILQKP